MGQCDKMRDQFKNVLGKRIQIYVGSRVYTNLTLIEIDDTFAMFQDPSGDRYKFLLCDIKGFKKLK